MRPGLLSDIVTIGYEILLEGDQVKLHYRRQDNPPDTVKPLIDELRQYKADVVKILKMGSIIPPTEKLQPKSNTKAVWPSDVQSLVDWFMIQKPPTEPFLLEPHLWVVGPGKFFESLRCEIETGPRGTRARMGTLQWDLRNLKAYLN